MRLFSLVIVIVQAWVFTGVHAKAQQVGVQVEICFPGVHIEADDTGRELPTVQVGQVFSIDVLVSGGDRSTGDLQLDGMQELGRKHFVGSRGSSTQVSVVNGQYSFEKTYSYKVRPDKPGVYAVGPAHVKHAGKVVASKKVYFRVTEEVYDRDQKEARVQDHKKKSFSRFKVESEIFCQLEPHKKEVIVGEPFDVSFFCYSSVPLVQLEWVTSPQFPDFVIKKSDDRPRQYQESVNGRDYTIYELRYTLVPLKAGSHVFNQVVAECATPVKRQHRSGALFEDFFQGVFDSVQRKRIKSEPVQVTVKEPPPYAEKTDGIGQFTEFKVELDHETVQQGQPFKLFCQVSGVGNVEYINDISPKLPKACKVYKSKSSFKEDPIQDGIGGTKKFEFVIQCAQPGELTIPEQRFIYFDTHDQAHKVLTSTPLSITIEGNASAGLAYSLPSDKADEGNQQGLGIQEHAASGGQQVRDIHFIEEEISLGCAENRALSGLLFFLIVLLITGLMFLGNPASKKYLEKIRFFIQGDITARQVLEDADKQLEQAVARSDASVLHQVFISVVSLLVGVSRNEVREDQVEEVLARKGWSREKIYEFLLYFNRCASLQFGEGKDQQVVQQEHKELLQRARYWLLLLSK